MNTPTNGRSAFQLFFNERYSDLRQQYPMMKVDALVSLAAKEWSELYEAWRIPYEIRAAEDSMLGLRIGRQSEHSKPSTSAADIKPEDFTKPFCDFLTENPTIFHTVDHFKNKLNKAGYKEVGIQSELPTSVT
jgi:hypothetical protein